jgi:SAM-dependent methyltransferase
MAIVHSEPLEPEWQKVVEAALIRKVDDRALARMVARQSARYRGEDVALAHADALAARALFWFPRDVHKCALPIHELLAAGAVPDRPLRILDVGAGLGATSLGCLRALGNRRTVANITAIDNDPQALTILRRMAAHAMEHRLLPHVASLVTETRDISLPGWSTELGTFDLVLVGLSLVEVTRSLGDEGTRSQALATMLRELLAQVADDGALVVIEPATRDEARCLQRTRDQLVTDGMTVFAPCTHTRPCPMLMDARDWCHEDMADVSLPPWLVAIAKEAGLRWEGLTFSYLTLRNDKRTLRDVVPAGGYRALRLLSAPIVTKGKTEAIVCGECSHERTHARMMELSREAKRAEGTTLSSLTRGDVMAVHESALGDSTTVRISPTQWTRVE